MTLSPCWNAKVRVFSVSRTLSNSEGEKNNYRRHDIAYGIDRISD